MKHIHFVIYRLKSIAYSKVEFIESYNDVRIQQRTITFTSMYDENRIIFINKMTNSGIMMMFIFILIIFIFIYFILLAKCCAFTFTQQMLIVFLV
jgi:hypothetical protein